MLGMKTLKNSKLSSVVYSCVLLVASGSVGAELLASPAQQPQIPATTVHAQQPQTQTQTQAYSASVWGRMSAEFQFNHEDGHAEVIAQIAKLQAHKKELYKQLQADAPYINYFFQQTHKQGLPAELALLPVIESDCDPDSRSNVGAVGWWQFMPGTAAGLGLDCNPAHDARKDIGQSTDAALIYLNGLHKTFQDDWMLALAAYNYGSGNVHKAIKKQKKWYAGIGFWGVAPALPAETQAYVPKLLALAAVVRDPGRYGIELPATIDLHMSASKAHQTNANGGSTTKPASQPVPVMVADSTDNGATSTTKMTNTVQHASRGYIRSNGVSSSLMRELSLSVADM